MREGDIVIHIWAFLDPLREDLRISVRSYDDKPTKAVFEMVKASAKLEGCKVIMFDGVIYRFDSAQGKFIRTKWDSIEWE